MKNNNDDRWIRARQEIEKRALPNRRRDSRITEALDDFSNVDPDLRYLICDSDDEFAELVQSTLPVEQFVDVPSAAQLSSSEKAELDGRILASEILGSDVLESTDENPFDNRPMTKAELEKQVRATAEALEKAYTSGDAAAIELFEQNGPQPRPPKTNGFSERLLAAAGEGADFISSEVRAFVKAYARNDRAAMRAAIQPVVRDLSG